MRTILLSLLFFSYLSFGSEISVGEKNEYDVSPSLTYFDDISGKMDLDEVLAKDFSPIPLEKNSFPLSSNAHWFTFSIENNTTKTRSYYLEYEPTYVHEIDYYLLKNKDLVSSYSTGALRTYSSRAIDYHKYLFPITLKPKEKKEVYLRLRHYSTVVPIAFKLKDDTTYFSSNYSDTLLQGLFFGVLIVMFFYNGTLYFMTKYKPFLIYILYLGTINIFWSINHGFGIFLFDINNVTLYSLILFSSSMLYTVFMVWFMMEVLQLRSILPKAFIFLKGINYIFLLTWIITSLLIIIGLNHYITLPMKVFMPTFLLMNLSILIIVGFLSMKQNRVARYILVAWLFVIATMSLMLLKILSIIPPYNWIEPMMQGAIVIESVLFSLILGHEYKEQKKILLHQARQAEMGSMIENIAHQWRQPLSGINADVFNVDVCLDKNRLDNARELLNSIEEKTLMMSNIIDDFQNFYDSKKTKHDFEIGILVNKALKFNHERLENHNITFEIKLGNKLTIHGNENEYLQVILAVLSNAIEALKEEKKSDKIIKISIEREGKYAVLTIENNGEKILPEHLLLIFNPYFTTKDESNGSGIGLFMCKKIVAESFDGILDVQNNEEGVCVKIKVIHV